MKNLKIALTFIFITTFISVFSQNGKGAAYKQLTVPNINTNEAEIFRFISNIKNYGAKLKDVKSSVLQSSWLNRVRLYKMNGEYYLIATMRTKKGFKEYVYCYLTASDWNSFVNSSYLTYSESFNTFIHHKKCF